PRSLSAQCSDFGGRSRSKAVAYFSSTGICVCLLRFQSQSAPQNMSPFPCVCVGARETRTMFAPALRDDRNITKSCHVSPLQCSICRMLRFPPFQPSTVRVSTKKHIESPTGLLLWLYPLSCVLCPLFSFHFHFTQLLELLSAAAVSVAVAVAVRVDHEYFRHLIVNYTYAQCAVGEFFKSSWPSPVTAVYSFYNFQSDSVRINLRFIFCFHLPFYMHERVTNQFPPQVVASVAAGNTYKKKINNRANFSLNKVICEF
ncbi:Hypothetical predicted protein, partial [Drosophila guanche]